MKKFTYLLALLLIQTLIIAQNVEREEVVIEIGTGTWCQYCPGAASAADQLVEEGKDAAVIENHNGDQFTNTFSNARNSFYGISGYPTGRFDGVVVHEGGQACPPPFTNIYNTYLAKYNQRKVITSPYTID